MSKCGSFYITRWKIEIAASEPEPLYGSHYWNNNRMCNHRYSMEELAENKISARQHP
jgi:hypothetical protein